MKQCAVSFRSASPSAGLLLLFGFCCAVTQQVSVWFGGDLAALALRLGSMVFKVFSILNDSVVL